MGKPNENDKCADAIRELARAVTPIAVPYQDGDSSVGSLTEAVIYASKNLGRMADAIDELASAVKSLNWER